MALPLVWAISSHKIKIKQLHPTQSINIQIKKANIKRIAFKNPRLSAMNQLQTTEYCEQNKTKRLTVMGGGDFL